MQRVSVWKKFHLIYGFFFVRKIIAHWVTFFFYCVVIPATILVPEVHLTKPLAIYLPATITILNAACTPRYVNSWNWTQKSSFCFSVSYFFKHNNLIHLNLVSTQIFPSSCILDPIWECHVSPSIQGSNNRTLRSQPSKWMGCNWEAGEHDEAKVQCQGIKETKIEDRWKVIIILFDSSLSP